MKKNLIVQEAIKRTRTAFSSTVKVNRGWDGKPIKTFPVINMLELPEIAKEANPRRPGVLEKTFMLSVEHFFKHDGKDPMVKADDVLDKLTTAMETDERFNDIVISYYLSENYVVYYNDNVMSVVAVYIYKYIEDAKNLS